MIGGFGDELLLLVVMVLPVVGALFALAMPAEDRLALRYVAMGTSVTTALVGIWAAWIASNAPVAGHFGKLPVLLDGLSGPLLVSLVVAAPIALRSGAPRIFDRTQFYVVTVLFTQGLFASALVIDSVLWTLALAAIAAVPLFALVALYGGPQRGSTTLRAAMIWLIVDVLALAVVAWLSAHGGVDPSVATVEDLARVTQLLPAEQKPWVFLALAAPGLVRLGAGPFSVWLASYLDEAPVSAAIFSTCGAAPLGAHLVIRLALPVGSEGLFAVLPLVAFIGGLSVLLSGVIAMGERDLRRLLAQLLQSAGAATALCLLCFQERALAVGVVHIIVTGASATLVLAAVESVERRYETRDAVDLAGLGQATPLLAAFLVAGLFCLVGIPAVGAGSTLWAAAVAVAHSPAMALTGLPPLSSLWLSGTIVTGAALATLGVGQTARRLLQPAPRKSPLHLERMTFGQAARLYVPALVALSLGLSAFAVVDTALPRARDVVTSAVKSAHMERSVEAAP